MNLLIVCNGQAKHIKCAMTNMYYRYYHEMACVIDMQAFFYRKCCVTANTLSYLRYATLLQYYNYM